jgi:hypothetical protein
MKHEIISFNVQENVDMILKISKKGRGSRLKPVIGILRGSGGGKTMMLEELHRNLCIKDDVLSLAITFNNKTSYSATTDNWGTKSYKLSYQLSVIARLASCFLQVDFINLCKRFK